MQRICGHQEEPGLYQEDRIEDEVVHDPPDGIAVSEFMGLNRDVNEHEEGQLHKDPLRSQERAPKQSRVHLTGA